ncbi:sulfurtransferase complex subunit TusD [Candidatus Fukatsuia symbiotica]|uniref:Sulfurtransferase TusD n=1 Tax=Candidatus Fukatsuia symbiotica TaxID=1878942 RepID=A0A2U8I6S5_9GAMM|nr:sulfurtransferase complex subunit TusD [Candidatus Fukatsuia symbiotica]AWK14852.1 sulfurtransferase TusD [Candidatus Fukatsuia symbiotica]MEA9445193.1 sulfurtransferase complex subunit TusD [Candidatus Fukatsuia symbiotica]
MHCLNYCLLVTGPAYGTQQASSAYQFAKALLVAGHQLTSVFFYREGVLNANQLTAPATDEFDLVRAWQKLARDKAITLNVCVAAALRRGVSDQAVQGDLGVASLQPNFTFSGLGTLAEALWTCDRVVQF